ncbi:RagB/SusD family nutrient uptake outer membrane protein [Algoriphagus winogradskyi]|uniref:SusD family protein n=1 Tax=Algoriphagus winogradskyi TaxID=237017 RepID=A0ABY1PGB6_9BACT|nr:RagB/SusD family nutrient uptake outer membrane protein [Algoriphagus winogradskyi]SMP33483.1 SusD family protein [Algoriphagus winogradskyi]
MKKYCIKILCCISVLISYSCQDYLDEKPQKSLVVPATVDDVRALLDSYSFLNANSLISFILADDWVTTSQNWETLNPWEQNAYLWKKSVFEPNERSGDYQSLHGRVFYGNVSLDILEKIDDTSDSGNSVLIGEALALRARAMFELAQLFLPSPNSALANETRIPVNLKSDINATLEMLNVYEVLELAKADLEAAFTRLPDQAQYKTRADKSVAKSFLARIYLYEGEWQEAYNSAAYVVQQKGELMDYSTLDSASSYPFSLFNTETLFYSMTSSFPVTASAATFILPELYSMYGESDLRKSLFFTLDQSGLPLFKGSYTGDFNLFTGISMAEAYLVAAESAIRLSEVDNGLAHLNALGVKRYSDFEEWSELEEEKALELVLEERRKELVFRGLRWYDMKRLNELGLGLEASREINGIVYSLSSADQYTLELPPYEIELGNR